MWTCWRVSFSKRSQGALKAGGVPGMEPGQSARHGMVVSCLDVGNREQQSVVAYQMNGTNILVERL